MKLKKDRNSRKTLENDYILLWKGTKFYLLKNISNLRGCVYLVCSIFTTGCPNKREKMGHLIILNELKILAKC